MRTHGSMCVLTEQVEVGVEGRHDVAGIRLDANAGETRHRALGVRERGVEGKRREVEGACG